MMVTQVTYPTKMLERASMSECHTMQALMEARLKLSKESPEKPVDATFYRSIIWSLKYLVHTRSDILFAVGFLSRFMEAPRSYHLATVKYLLWYISGTIMHECVYQRGDGENQVGYSNSDHVGDLDSRKSTSGILFFLDSSPIS